MGNCHGARRYCQGDPSASRTLAGTLVFSKGKEAIGSATRTQPRTKACVFEATNSVVNTNWQFVGRGRGVFAKEASYDYVGEGSGEFRKEPVISYRIASVKPECKALLAVFCLATAVSLGVLLERSLSATSTLAAPPRIASATGAEKTTGPPVVPTTAGFDCRNGYSTWIVSWSLTQQSWCCTNYGRACPTTTTTVREWDCNKGADAWADKWGDDKKAYCCKSTGRGCPEADYVIASENAVPVMPART